MIRRITQLITEVNSTIVLVFIFAAIIDCDRFCFNLVEGIEGRL